MILNKYLVLLLTCSIFSACTHKNENMRTQEKLSIVLADSNSSLNTISLFYNLKKLSEEKIIFGHQHSSEYGIGWRWEENRSDVKDVTGSFPGLIGQDFMELEEGDTSKINHLKKMVIDAHDAGIVNAFCWHAKNFVTDRNFYDTTIVVKHILPGGSHHQIYKRELDRIAQFTKHLIGKDGKVIPIIFRPYHEFDGSWFWWGKHFCTRDEFVALWQFTVDYLKNVRKVRNFIYVFSPDRNFNNEEEFLERYPGDEYVDMVGMDDYWDFTPDGEGLDAITTKLKIVTQIAENKNKIAAFTETGLEKIPDDKWWTEKLLKVMDHDSIKISFVMVWRNAHLDHFYAPYKGHKSAADFIEFKNNPKIIFADELPNLFRIDSTLSN